MNCKTAIKYIYLQKELILSESDRKYFEEHIASCADCKKELAKAGNYFSTISNLQFDESLAEDDSLTNMVMSKINNRQNGLLERVLDFAPQFLIKPAVRYAMAASILFICLSYITEEYRALHKINLMEDKFYAISTRQIKAGGGLPINTEEFQNFITGEKQYLKLPGSWVLMKETDLVKRIEELSNQPGAELLLNKQTDLQLLLNHPEVKKIIEKDDALKKIFSRIMPEGVVNHEN